MLGYYVGTVMWASALCDAHMCRQVSHQAAGVPSKHGFALPNRTRRYHNIWNVGQSNQFGAHQKWTHICGRTRVGISGGAGPIEKLGSRPLRIIRNEICAARLLDPICCTAKWFKRPPASLKKIPKFGIEVKAACIL